MTKPLADYAADDQARKQPKAVIGQLAELLERSGIRIEDIGKVTRVNAWQGFIKNAEGEPEKVDLVGIELAPEWASGPDWPVVQPAKPCVVRKSSVQKRSGSANENVRRTVILPDPQIGYLRHGDGTLEPMHDETAMTVALQIVRMVRPHRIVNLGDFFDFAEWSSKFLVTPEFVLTTQPAIDRGHRFLVEQQAAAGPQLEAHDLFEGNHDNRVAVSIARNAMAALRLRRANQPEGWPVMSIPHLLHLDELGVTYRGGYPAGRVKLADGYGRQAPLVALHGERTDMQRQARSERQSTVQGHAHHVSCHSETYEVDGEPAEVEAWSLGCLCRLDGAVPSTKGGHDVHGRPVRRQESWQHAVGVVTETGTGWHLEVVRIRDGRAMYHGKEIEVA